MLVYEVVGFEDLARTSRGEAGSFERREPPPLERARLERRAMSFC
jgi:hypothetical protein